MNTESCAITTESVLMNSPRVKENVDSLAADERRRKEKHQNSTGKSPLWKRVALQMPRRRRTPVITANPLHMCVPALEDAQESIRGEQIPAWIVTLSTLAPPSSRSLAMIEPLP